MPPVNSLLLRLNTSENPPQTSSSPSTSTSEEVGNALSESTLQSLSLSQLRDLVLSLPSASPTHPKHDFSFHYAEKSTIIDEINEFHSYAETRQWKEHASLFSKAHAIPFSNMTLDDQKELIKSMLVDLQDHNQVTRVITARKLIYISQGAWIERELSQQTLLETMFEYQRILRDFNAMSVYLCCLQSSLSVLAQK